MVTFAAMRAQYASEYAIRMVNKFRKREMSQVVHYFSQFIDKYYSTRSGFESLCIVKYILIGNLKNKKTERDRKIVAILDVQSIKCIKIYDCYSFRPQTSS